MTIREGIANAFPEVEKEILKVKTFGELAELIPKELAHKITMWIYLNVWGIEKERGRVYDKGVQGH